LPCDNCEKRNTIMRHHLPSTKLRHVAAIAALAAVVAVTSLGLQARADTRFDTQAQPVAVTHGVQAPTRISR
jgi:hypothetical protein